MKFAKVEKITLCSNAEKNEQEVTYAIMRASNYIHKTTMRGGGQFIIVEGKLATDAVKGLPRFVEPYTLNNRYQVVFPGIGLYKNCITVVRRGEYMKFWLKGKMKEKDGTVLSIPELKMRPTKTRRQDDVCVIYLELDVNATDVVVERIYK